MTKFICALLIFAPMLDARPLLVNTMPHAGTRYIQNTLIKYFTPPIWTGPKLRKGDISKQDVQRIIECSNSVEFPFVHHFNNIPFHLVETFSQHNLSVVFVPRDPRESAVSDAIEHVCFPKSTRNILSFEEQEKLVDEKRDEILARLNARWRTFILHRVRTLRDWKRYKTAFPKTVSIIPFTSLKYENETFWFTLFEAFGYSKTSLDLERLEKLITPTLGKAGYRNSKKNEWRGFVTKEMEAFANQAIGKELFEYYGFKK